MARAPALEKSIIATADREPWQDYRRLRERGEVVWDAELNAWLVLSYEACKNVLRQDDSVFDAPHEHDAHLEISGRSKVNNLHGPDHDRSHQWWMKALSPGEMEQERPRVRAIVADAIDRFAARGSAELGEELADRVSFRVIAAVLGLPWRDDAFVEEFGRELRCVMRFVDRQYDPEAPALLREALEASRSMKCLLAPYVHDGAGDIIARLVEDGSTLLESWGEGETFENVYATFSSGMDTTSSAMCNGFHLLLSRPELIERVRGDEVAVKRFVEEVLRLRGTVHFRPRIAQEDCEVAGVRVVKGDRLLVVFMAGGRDEEHYADADGVALDRRAPRDHLGFGFGPRTCVGMALARVELQEATAAALARLDGLRCDLAAPPPAYRGFILRSYRPLHVLFTATAAAG